MEPYNFNRCHCINNWWAKLVFYTHLWFAWQQDGSRSFMHCTTVLHLFVKIIAYAFTARRDMSHLAICINIMGLTGKTRQPCLLAHDIESVWLEMLLDDSLKNVAQ